MKKSLLLIFPLVGLSFFCIAQNTVTSGNWNDPTVWSGGAVPAAGGTVNVNNPLTINTNLSPTGVWTFNSNTTDQPGGTAYFFNPNDGTNALTVSAGVTVTFEAGGANQSSNGANCSGCNQFNSGTIDIYGTLILGSTLLNNSGNLNVNIRAGGTLIINGDLVNKNNSGTFTVNGSLFVYGNFDNATGSVTVAGTGTIDTTGTLTSTGASTIFGTTNDCGTGPCSGTTLTCTFTNTISPTSKTICSSTSPGTLTCTTNGPTPTYQWQNSTDGTTYTNIAGATSSTFATPSLTVTTWYRVQVTASSCTSSSAAVKVTVLSGGGWLGTTNNWGAASNWCSNSVPTSSTDVVISNSASIANMPTIASGTSALCNSLTINSTFPASSVTIAAAADASLNVSGNFVNNGSFTDNSTASAAGVKFVGGVEQTVSGSTANVFNNLTIANTSGATPAISITTNNITVNNNLTMTSGIVNINGFTITLGTAAGSTGTLAYSAGTIYGGNIERWFPTSTVAIGNVAGHFPIGTSSDYRPVFFGNAGLSAGGTIKVRHSSTAGSTAVSPTFTDNGGTVVIRSNSFWTVTTANSIGTGTHALRTEGTGFGTVGAVTDLRQTLVSGIAPGSDGAHAGTTSNPQVNRSGLTTVNLSNSFYWGSINSTATPLPVSLISFNGQQIMKQINLNWSTASELNFDYFDVERSSNAKLFTSIGKITGHGTSNVRNDYSLTDEKPIIGKNYYRLKSVDFDGYTEYFDVVSVDFTAGKLFFISPNPSDGASLGFTLNFVPDGNASIIVYDNLSNIVGLFTPSGHSQNITFPNPLKSGLYYAKIIAGDFVKVERFVVR